MSAVAKKNEKKKHDPKKEGENSIVAYREQVKAAERIVALKTAHDDLIEFCRLTFPDPSDPSNPSKSRYDPQKHHRVIAAALQEVEKGNWLRLIITMPPRAGKSELAVKKFIPWLIGRDPYRSVILASYNDIFAEDAGRSCRNTIRLPVFKQIFPNCDLRKGSAASDRLETMEGGIAAFVGVGGSTTGRGADFLIIDDPIKDREQANSRIEREKQWDWFNDVAMTRLSDFAARVVIIMTRWHEDDIVGRLTDPKNDKYSEKEAAKWKILALPALAEENDPMGRKKGEALWPNKFPASMMESIRNANPRGFSALYQCRPTPEDGEFFRRDHFITYKPDELPKNLRFYCASDLAVSTEEYGNKSVLLPVGVDENDTIWILPDLFWNRVDSSDVVEAMLLMMQRRRPVFWFGEKGQIAKSIGPFLRKRMQEERIYCSIVEVAPVKDKMQRAQSFQARMAMGKVRWPGFAPWYADALDEMLKFPQTKRDDLVDACAWIGNGLTLQIAATPPNIADKIPKEGTMDWIIGAAKWQADQRKRATRDGF